MKALTLTQPWASLMAYREKTIETRSWYTTFRGEIVIHSAKGFPKSERDMCSWDGFHHALRGQTAEQLPLSRGLCVVRLLGCVPTDKLQGVEMLLGQKPSVKEISFGNYSSGRYAWVTEYVRRLDDAGPVKGALGLWNWPAEVPR